MPADPGPAREMRSSRILLVVVGLLLLWLGSRTFPAHLPGQSPERWYLNYQLGTWEGIAGILLIFYAFLTLYPRRGDPDDFQEPADNVEDDSQEPGHTE